MHTTNNQRKDHSLLDELGLGRHKKNKEKRKRKKGFFFLFDHRRELARKMRFEKRKRDFTFLF
jgi:hypothetical protein